MVGVVHEEISLSSPSGIIHGHLIVLVRHKMNPNVSSEQSKMLWTNFKNYFKIFHFSKFSTTSLTHSLTHSLTRSLTHSLTHSLMHSVKRSGKLATDTTLLLWQKCLEFHGKKSLSQYQMPTSMHCSLAVLALIPLYGGHCFSVWLPAITSHVRLPASRNNPHQHMTMFPDSMTTA